MSTAIFLLACILTFHTHALRQIHLALGDKMDAELFRSTVISIYGSLPKLDRIVENGEPLNKAQAEERRCLLSSANDLFSLFFQLTARSRDLHRRIYPSREDRGRIYGMAFKYVSHRIRRVEIWWAGFVDLLYFPLPPQAQALTDTSKHRLLRDIDLSSPDAKKRSFLMMAADLVEEMLFLHRLERFGIYRSVKKHFLALRYVTYSLAVMLNITLGTSVVGPGNAGPPYVSDKNDKVISWYSTECEQLANALAYLVMVGYAVLAFYQFVTRTYLVYARVLRTNAEKERCSQQATIKPVVTAPARGGAGSIAGPEEAAELAYAALVAAREEAQKRFFAIGNWMVLFKLQNFILAYLCVGGIFVLRFGQDALHSLTSLLMLPFSVLLVSVLDDFFADTSHSVGVFFQTFRAVFSERDTLILTIFTLLSIGGKWRFYFYSLLLLDITTLSARLGNVVNAVTKV